MDLYVLLAIAIIPVVLLGRYIYNKDQIKEPQELLVKVFIYGCLSVIPAIMLESMFEVIFSGLNLPKRMNDFVSMFIGVALVEEFCKYIAMKGAIYKKSEFDEMYDGLIYAVFAALGFACIENIAYVFSFGIGTGITRGLLAVPSHVCDGVIMGYFVSCAKRAKSTSKIKEIYFLFMAIAVSTITHGFYDFCLTVGELDFLLAFIVFVIAIYISVIRVVKDVSKKGERL